MAKRNKKSSTTVVSLISIDQRICELHKLIQVNSDDIHIIKQEIAYGKGGVKVLVWVIGIVTALASAWNIFGKSN
jgi:hypothetical protein